MSEAFLSRGKRCHGGMFVLLQRYVDDGILIILKRLNSYAKQIT